MIENEHNEKQNDQTVKRGDSRGEKREGEKRGSVRCCISIESFKLKGAIFLFGNNITNKTDISVFTFLSFKIKVDGHINNKVKKNLFEFYLDF